MTPIPRSSRRWLLRTGLAAAAAGATVGVAGCTGSARQDPDANVQSVALAAAPAAGPALAATPPAGPAPAAAPPPQAPPPTEPVGRNPFRPLTVPDAAPAPPAPGPDASAAAAPAQEQPELTRVLHRGSRGDEVVLVQSALVDRGARLTVDGIYGPVTTAAVTAFQRLHALAPDGVVGARTWAALRPPAQG